MKNLSNGGYSKGFKIILFLYKVKNKTIPLGFALIHKESSTQEMLVLKMLKRLRSEFKFKPKILLADAAFSTQEIMKRLTNYGWGFVFKGKKTYSLNNKQIKKQIPRGYGSQTGKLKNDVKVKVLRHSKRVFITNRVSLTDVEVLEYYGIRWKIEETFRAVKGCIGLNRCQQHTMLAQEIYIFGCFVLYAIIETIRDCSVYKAFQNVISGKIVIDKTLVKEVFAM